MPKQDFVRRIDVQHSPSGNGSPTYTTIVGGGSGYEAHKVDGFHASATPTENTLLPLGPDAKFPSSVIPDFAVSDGTQYGGWRHFGKTTYLTRSLLVGGAEIRVAGKIFADQDYVVLQAWNKPTITLQILGAAAYEAGDYVYPIRRNFRTYDATVEHVDYDPGTEVVFIGAPGSAGGFLTLNSSGSGGASPSISAWTNENDLAPTWRLTLGRLSAIKDSEEEAQMAFVAKFPNSEDEDWRTFGLAARSLFLDGQFAVAGGTIYGDLNVTGTITVQGDDSSGWVEIGDTTSGFGWLLRSQSGPAVMALAPYIENDIVVSPVAFVINNRGQKGLFFHEDGTGEGILEIGADTLVSGNFRVGETFIVGTGTWSGATDTEGDFSGIAIDSEWGFIGRADETTVSAAETQGAEFTDIASHVDTVLNGRAWDVFWDKRTGKWFTGGGAIGFGREGMSLKVRGPQNRVGTIKWFEDGTGGQRIMEMGSDAVGEGYLGMVQRVDGVDEVTQRFSFDINGYYNGNHRHHSGHELQDPTDWKGIEVYNAVSGTNNLYTAPADGKHKFYIGEQLVAELGSGMTWQLPFTLAGSESTAYWSESGRLGFNIDTPQATAHIVGVPLQDGEPAVPQLMLSLGDMYTKFRTGPSGTYWTTSGNIVLGPATNAIVPMLDYGVDLGAPANRFGTIYASNLNVETLVSTTKLATVGGRIIVAPTTQLVFPAEASNTKLYLRDQFAVTTDTVILENNGVIEAIRLTDNGTPAFNINPDTGESFTYWEYSAIRGLNGEAQYWPSGSAVVNTGNANSGWIDLYSSLGLASSSIYGPSIAGIVRTSTTWNDWSERWAIGNLNGVYGYSATTWGVGFGKPSGTHITIDDTNGYRLWHSSTSIAQWDADGDLSLGATGAITLSVSGDAVFSGTIYASDGHITGQLIVGTGTFTPPS